MLRLFAAVSSLLLVTLPAPAADSADPVVAVCGDLELRRSEIAPSAAAWRALDPDLRSQRVERAAARRTLALASEASGAASGAAVQQALAEAEREVLIGALRQSVQDSVTIPEASVEAYLAAHRDALSQPEKVRLRNLFLHVPEGASVEQWEAAREEIEALREDLLAAPERFAEAAREHSDSESRFAGGLLGAVPPGELRSEVEAVAFALEPGAISEAIETPEGLTLLQSIGRVEAAVLGDEEARERVRRWLARREADRLWEELRGELEPAAAPGPEGEPATGDDADPDTLATALAELAAERRPATVESDPAWRAAAAEHALALGLDSEPSVRWSLAQRRETILAAAELDRRVASFGPEPAPSHDDLRREYARRPESFRVPPRYHLRAIRLDLDERPGSLAERTREAEALLGALASGTPFDELAGRHSAEPSAPRGGDLGWLPRSRVAALGPNVLAAVSELEPGETSRLVRQDDHLWILRLEGSEAGRRQTLEEVARRLGERLTARQARARARHIERELAAELACRLVPESAAPRSSEPRGRGTG